jgi:hypothetical protein
MPVFNLGEGDGPAIKNGFKYYWAIAIPFTFAVLVLWGLSVWLPWDDWLSIWNRKKKSGTEELCDLNNDAFELN